MPGIEIKGRSKIANYRHGGRTGKFGGGRTNLLEELGRVEGERSNPNRRAEISRVHGELNRGYAKGGRAGFKSGTKYEESVDKKVSRKTAREWRKDLMSRSKRGLPSPHSKGYSKDATKRFYKAMESGKFRGLTDAGQLPSYFGTGKAKGGRIGLKEGTDKRWMQKVSASIKKRGTKGKCTPITKPGCTGRAKALAKTFKKMGRERKSA